MDQRGRSVVKQLGVVHYQQQPAVGPGALEYRIARLPQQTEQVSRRMPGLGKKGRERPETELTPPLEMPRPARC
jgi:hypothetical protein